MGKGLRSKSKRAVRTARRSMVVQTPRHIELEEKKQTATLAALAAEPLERPPAAMEAERDVPMAMVEDTNLPELTTKNPARLAKKLKVRRRAAEGKTQGVKKKGKPLAGANQFHKKKKSRR